MMPSRTYTPFAPLPRKLPSRRGSSKLVWKVKSFSRPQRAAEERSAEHPPAPGTPTGTSNWRLLKGWSRLNPGSVTATVNLSMPAKSTPGV